MNADPLNLVLTLLPELILLAGGSLIVMLLPGRGERSRRSAALISLFAAGLAVLALEFGPRPWLGFASAVALDLTAVAGRWAAPMVGILLLGAAFALPETRRDASIEAEPANRAAPEFFMMLLFSLAGLMLTAMANDLIVLFLAIELTSVPTVLAVALSRPQLSATEAAGKYFFLGALSAALLLMGLAYLYGLTGQTRLPAVAATLAVTSGSITPLLLVVAMGLALAGLAFKIAAFPYHVYLADVYQGAAAPLSGWLAFVPKAAGLIAIARLLSVAGAAGGDLWLGQPVWHWLIWGLAVATMTTGNVLALWQRNAKRMLAYSSVAHSGYLLVGLMILPEAGRQLPLVVFFYLVAYGLANLGAFSVLSSVRVPDGAGGTREAETFDDLAGLSRRRPGLAAAMAVFALSLMGLPPAIGFIGKAYLFLGAYRSGWTVLVVIALLNAAVGAAYYLRLIAACWFGSAEEQGASAEATADQPAAAGVPSLVVAILAAAVLVLGVLPGRVLSRLEPGREYRLVNPFARPKQPAPTATPNAPATSQPESAE